MHRLAIGTILVCLGAAPASAAPAQAPSFSRAQPPAPMRGPARVSVQLRNGSRLIGEVVASRSDGLVLRNAMG